MMSWIAVALGGALGSVARHWVNLENLVSRLAAELPLLSETLTRGYFDHAVAAPQLYASWHRTN